MMRQVVSRNMETNIFKDLECKEIRVGQEVVITIIGEGEYFGKIHFINPDRNRLQLEDIVYRRTNSKLSGIKKFYKPEIKSIEIISKGVVGEDEKDEQRNESTNIKTPIKFEVSVEEFEPIKSMIANYIEIDNIGEEYDLALSDILKQDFIGLNAKDMPNGNITSILLSTPFRMYVFNIEVIGGIEDGLKEILKSETPVKVIHGASRLVDSLRQYHGVNVKGIFDTMISLKYLGYCNTNTTIRECITEHMILPSEFVAEVEDSANAHMTAVYTTAILLKFHNFITAELLTNAYKSFNENMDFCRNKTSDEAQLVYRNEKSVVQRLEAVPPFKLYQLNSVDNID